MKIVLDKDLFLENLSLAAKFTSTKLSTTTTLQGVLLKNKAGEMEISSTNLNSYFLTKIKTQEKQKTELLVEPKKIIEFLSFLPAGKITLTTDEKKLTITKEKTQGTFPVWETKDFPTPPVLEGEKEQTIKTDFLAKNLPFILFSTSPDETRPTLTGVNFLSQDEELTMVSTDGFRLSLIKTKNNHKLSPMLVPADFLSEVLKFLKEEKEVGLTASDKEKTILFKVGNKEFYSRLIDGDFPPYEKVVPVDKKTTVVVDREEFLKNVKVISVFARDFSNIVLCEFKKDGIYLTPKVDGEEKSSAYQEADLEGEEQKVAFNFKFLIDFLGHTGLKKVIIEVLRPDAPVVFKLEGNKEFLHIIMPVRIQG